MVESEEGTLFISKTRPTSPVTAPNHPFWSPVSMRFWLALLLAFGYTTIVMQKLNMGIGMVCMVNSTWLSTQYNRSQRTISHVNVSANCVLDEQQKKQYEGPFEWDFKTQGMLFSAPYFGAILFCIIGGWLSDRYGAVAVLLVANTMGMLGNVATPLAALYAPLSVILTSRFIVGLGQGLFFPAINKFVAEWYPAFEMSTVIAFWTAGNQIAILVLHPVAPLLCSAKHILGGWSLIFIVTIILGILSVIWVLLWTIFVTSNPQKNRFMGETEKQFLLAKTSQMGSRKTAIDQTPWAAMLKSMSVWAIMVTNSSFSLVFFTMQVYTPTYFRDVLKFDLNQNGIISIIPFLCGLGGKFIFAAVADLLKQKTNISQSTICRVFNTIGSGLAAVCLCVLAVLDCERALTAVVLLCLFYFATAAVIPGFLTSTVTIAPQYTGIIASLGQAAANVGGLCGPYLIAALVTTGTLQEWRLVFYTMSAVLTAATLFFALFGRAEPQKWSVVSPKQSEAEKT